MYENKNFDQNSQNMNTESQAAKLAIIATAITTFGDALGTIAAILAFEEEQQERMDKEEYIKVQKQIDYLTTEFEKLKNK
ncbi:hypothetical protein ACFX4I_02305 [Peribacillus sp. YIM B13472]|uniref:hypothetical protein n=1 Tax=Peribacillus sp. YIM B13472 TaxID=3366297 RepID=UPI00366B742D